MSHPFLIGRRVQLRAIEEEDAPAYVEWLSSPDMREFLLIRFPQTTQGEREWIASMRGKEKPPANLVFSIERKSDGRHIGCCALHQIDWVHRRAMTGSFLGPPALRGKGLGTEAKNLLLDYAFGELGLQSIWAIAFDRNAASRRALEKQGYRASGVFRKAFLVGGEWSDAVYFDLLREEWAAMRGARKGAGGGQAARSGRRSAGRA